MGSARILLAALHLPNGMRFYACQTGSSMRSLNCSGRHCPQLPRVIPSDPYSRIPRGKWLALWSRRGVRKDLHLRGGGLPFSSIRPFAASVNSTAAASHSSYVTLDIQGLKCGGCVSKSEKALARISGVDQASVNLVTGTAKVKLLGSRRADEEGPIALELLDALNNLGYTARILDVGPREDTKKISRVTPLERYKREEEQSQRHLWASLALLGLSGTAHIGHHLMPHSLANLLPFHLPLGWFSWFEAGLATMALAGPGAGLIRSGLRSLHQLSPDMNSLVSVGTLAVFCSSLLALIKPSLGLVPTFHEPVMLLGAVLLGRSLEARQRLRATRGLQGLFDLQPEQARVVHKDQEVSVEPAESVCVGDTVEVLPGDRVPVDGVVISGHTAVDESSLTGEPLLKSCSVGDTIKAGTVSMGDGGVVRVRTTASGKHSVLASIIALVEEAQAQKAPIQRFADAVAGKFTWLVFGASTSTLLFWGIVAPMVFNPVSASPALSVALSKGETWGLALRLAVDVCLVACPCALGLATPTAVMVGTGSAAERGLLLKGADVLEKAQKVTTVMFDKTGTLTSGQPSVAGVVRLAQGWTEENIIEAAVAVEQFARHPLAEAVVKAAALMHGGNAQRHQAKMFTSVPGMGACAQVSLTKNGGWSMVNVGSPAYMAEVCQFSEGKHFDVTSLAAELSRDLTRAGENRNDVRYHMEAGHTPVLVAVDGKIIGAVFTVDTLRPDAVTAVADLQGRGMRVRLASGDQKKAVSWAAEVAGVAQEDVSWCATPADKASLVRDLQAQGEVVLVVGDGMNDGPALASADVGVAMGGGTGVAISAADMVLMRNDLIDVGKALDVSRLTMLKIRANLLWALGYNVIALPIAAGALFPGPGFLLTPSLAGAIMACSSVAVVSNSLLLRGAIARVISRMPGTSNDIDTTRR